MIVWDSSVLLCITLVCSILLLNSTHCISTPECTLSPSERPLGCLQSGALGCASVCTKCTGMDGVSLLLGSTAGSAGRPAFSECCQCFTAVILVSRQFLLRKGYQPYAPTGPWVCSSFLIFFSLFLRLNISTDLSLYSSLLLSFLFYSFLFQTFQF